METTWSFHFNIHDNDNKCFFLVPDLFYFAWFSFLGEGGWKGKKTLNIRWNKDLKEYRWWFVVFDLLLASSPDITQKEGTSKWQLHTYMLGFFDTKISMCLLHMDRKFASKDQRFYAYLWHWSSVLGAWLVKLFVKLHIYLDPAVPNADLEFGNQVQLFWSHG